jgi:hypothetical protein
MATATKTASATRSRGAAMPNRNCVAVARNGAGSAKRQVERRSVRIAWDEWVQFDFLPEGAHRVEAIERDGDDLLVGTLTKGVREGAKNALFGSDDEGEDASGSSGRSSSRRRSSSSSNSSKSSSRPRKSASNGRKRSASGSRGR